VVLQQAQGLEEGDEQPHTLLWSMVDFFDLIRWPKFAGLGILFYAAVN